MFTTSKTSQTESLIIYVVLCDFVHLGIAHLRLSTQANVKTKHIWKQDYNWTYKNATFRSSFTHNLQYSNCLIILRCKIILKTSLYFIIDQNIRVRYEKVLVSGSVEPRQNIQNFIENTVRKNVLSKIIRRMSTHCQLKTLFCYHRRPFKNKIKIVSKCHQ